MGNTTRMSHQLEVSVSVVRHYWAYLVEPRFLHPTKLDIYCFLECCKRAVNVDGPPTIDAVFKRRMNTQPLMAKESGFVVSTPTCYSRFMFSFTRSALAMGYLIPILDSQIQILDHSFATHHSSPSPFSNHSIVPPSPPSLSIE